MHSKQDFPPPRTKSVAQSKLVAVIIPVLAPFLLQGAETMPETVVYGRGTSLTVPAIESLRAELRSIPGGVDVIDAEFYKRGKAATLKDVLDYSPGVFVQPRFGAEEARISIRGSGLQRTFHGRGIKLMQDGVPVNNADGGFDFQAIEPLVAKAVEVYRGANALQFGSTTLGGAINFISPTGYDASPLTLRSEFGSFGTVRGLVSSGGVSGSSDYFMSLSHLSQGGFRDHSQQSNQRLFANIGHRLSERLETRFYLTLALTDSELPGTLTKDQLSSNPRQAQRNLVFRNLDYIDSNWKRDFDLLRLANKTTWQDGDQKLTFASFWSRKNLHHPIAIVIDQFTNDFGVGIRYDNTAEVVGHANRLTLGVTPTWGSIDDDRHLNILGKRGSQIASMKQQALNFDVFGEDQFWITKTVAATLGSQISYAERSNENARRADSQSWWGLNPKLGVLFQPDEATQLFANISRSFEPPSFGEIIVNNAFTQLESQTATTAEVGSRGGRGGVVWDASYYFSWIENELLQTLTEPGNPSSAVTKNAAKTTHQGFELGLGFDFLHPIEERSDALKTVRKIRDKLLIQTHYLWNNFRYKNNAAYGDGLLPGIPQHYLRTDLTYSTPGGFYIGPNIECVPKGYKIDAKGNLVTDPYFLLGAKVGVRRPTGWSFYAEARNLADKQYAATTNVVAQAAVNSAAFFPGDGRSFYIGVEFRW